MKKETITIISIIALISIFLISYAYFGGFLSISGLASLNSQENSMTLQENFERTSSGQLYKATYEQGKEGYGLGLSESSYVKYPSKYISLPAGTIEFWVKREYETGGNLEHTFFYFSLNKENQMRLVKNEANEFVFSWTSLTGVTQSVIAKNADSLLAKSQWTHVAVTYNPQSVRL